MKSKGQKFRVDYSTSENKYDFYDSESSKIGYVEKTEKGEVFTYCNSLGNSLFKMRFDPAKSCINLTSLKANAPSTPETLKRKDRVKRMVSSKSKKTEYVETPVVTLQTQSKNSRLYVIGNTDGKRFAIVVFHDDGKGFEMKKNDEIVAVFNSDQFVGLGGGDIRIASGENRNIFLSIISMVLIVQKEAMSGAAGIGLKFSNTSPKKYRSVKEEKETYPEKIDSIQLSPLMNSKESNQDTKDEEQASTPSQQSEPLDNSETDKQQKSNDGEPEQEKPKESTESLLTSPPPKAPSKNKIGPQVEQLILAGLSPRSTSVTPSSIPTTSSLNQEAFLDCWEKLDLISSLQAQ